MSFLSKTKQEPATNRREKSLFVFGIPLIGRHLTNNFDEICQLFGQTLQSCLNQSDRDFEIHVACNEIPHSKFVPSSTKIRYILTKPLSVEETKIDPRADVSLKRYELMRAAVDSSARYYLQFDADDLICSNFVSKVRTSTNNNGCIMNCGYLLDSRSGQLYQFPNPKFHNLNFYQLCGSSNVVFLDPTLSKQVKQANMQLLEKILWPGHHLAKQTYLNAGRAPDEFDFPACIYRANHGSNLFLNLNRQSRTNFMNAVASSCPPIAGQELQMIRREFCLV